MLKPRNIRIARGITLQSYETCPTLRISLNRRYNTKASSSESRSPALTSLQRSYLYVPSSSDRMLQKSLTTLSDVIIYDLEDSVPPSATDKNGARDRLINFLTSRTEELPPSERIAIRLNSINTPFFRQDISQALQLPSIKTFVLPKIHSPHDLHIVSQEIYTHSQLGSGPVVRDEPINIVASIESARAVFNLGGIAGWQSEHGPLAGGKLAGLLFAAEDYCADTSVIRTPSRRELLYTRSKIAITAKAFGLQAIDMVCVNYKDLKYLEEECQDGRELGFTGKQAIHPTQVDIIQATFVPSKKEGCYRADRGRRANGDDRRTHDQAG
ncbi:unnamed protein product [Somion occarium]|uniref:HpcH/HpaI aldolase/citrate lyase domain-containing protein n=1 Tax=Somion occarium TaxID=3059160 RepID=A0ABP1DZX4_9APHY